jgi:hypothetical protein
MQFKVPQNVQRADQIVGPLTLRQLIICSIGGTLAYGLYISIAKYYIWITWLPPVAIIAIITVAFSFIRPLDLNFEKWILLWVEYFILPRRRLWVQASSETLHPLIPPQTKEKKTTDAKAEQKASELEDKHKKIEELTKILNAK